MWEYIKFWAMRDVYEVASFVGLVGVILVGVYLYYLGEDVARWWRKR